jgi:DNA-binding Xre family transcriptional regulator
MKPIERLSKYLADNKIRYATLEADAGLGKGYLSKQVTHNASIGADILENICNALPNLNPTWLLTGKGEPNLRNMPTPQNISSLLAEPAEDNRVANIAKQQLMLIESQHITAEARAEKYKALAQEVIAYVNDLHSDNNILKQTIRLLTIEKSENK